MTPIVAIIKELKKRDKTAEVRFWCDRGFASQARNIVFQADNKTRVKTIFAGKLRRYHGRTLMQQLGDIPTLLRNIGDIFLFILGFFQSLFGLIFWRPQVVFTKGGFVCLPVGLAARLLGIPLVIHDSDTHPGLTNRILAKFAKAILTGAPLENYSYPADKSHYVGIPINKDFKLFSNKQQQKAKQKLGFSKDKPLILVTGGGLGARNINRSLLSIAKDLLEHASIIHICGSKHYQECQTKAPSSSDYKLLPFVDSNVAELMGAADLVVTRAGATTMLELAAVGKATIVVPNALLTAGHQIKNAKIYKKAGAIEILDEEHMVKDPVLMKKAIINLLRDSSLRRQLGQKLHSFAKPEAASEVVDSLERFARR